MKSITWGYKDEPITQGFGVYSPDTAAMYGYSSDYGWRAGTHIGLDIGVPKLTKIYAPVAGEVIQSGFAPYFRPNPVYILQENGDVAILGHLWSDTVTDGQQVKAGDMVGYSGEQTKTGTMIPDGTGPHLHFELRQPDNSTPSGYRAIDPTPELTGSTGTPNDTGSGSSDTGGDAGPSLLDAGWWRRAFLGLGGIVVVLVGVNALTGGSLGRSFRKAAMIAAA